MARDDYTEREWEEVDLLHRDWRERDVDEADMTRKAAKENPDCPAIYDLPIFAWARGDVD